MACGNPSKWRLDVCSARRVSIRGHDDSSAARVIALAHKRLAAGLTASQLREVAREEVERGLEFGGFAVLQCPLKPESEPSLRMLRDSSHCLVMITGDAPLTACHAASRVHIVDRRVLILTARCARVLAKEKALAGCHGPDSVCSMLCSREECAKGGVEQVLYC